MPIVDLTRIISPDMPRFPGDAPPQLARSVISGSIRETALQFPSHTGTHMDAAAHVLPEGRCLNDYPLAQLMGYAVVLDCPRPHITLEDLAPTLALTGAPDFFILRTGWESRWGDASYFQDCPQLDEALVRQLACSCKKGIALDFPSVDPIDSIALPNHKLILGAGLVLIENLCNTAQLPRSAFHFIALPLHYIHADGAPVRAIAAWEELC